MIVKKTLAFIFLFLGISIQSYSFYELEGVYSLTIDKHTNQEVVLKQRHEKDRHGISTGEDLALLRLDQNTGIVFFIDLRKYKIDYNALFPYMPSMCENDETYIIDPIQNKKAAGLMRARFEGNDFFFIHNGVNLYWEHGVNTSLYKLKAGYLPQIEIDDTTNINPITLKAFNNLLDNSQAKDITITETLTLSPLVQINNILTEINNNKYPIRVEITKLNSINSETFSLQDWLLSHLYNNEESRELLQKSTILAVYHVLGNRRIIGLAVNNETKKLFHWCTDLGQKIEEILFPLFKTIPNAYQDIDIKCITE